MLRLIGFDAQLLMDAALTGIAVFVLFFGLSYLLFNPVRDILKKRREKIASELENAAKDEASAKALKTEYEEKLANVSKEVEDIMEKARKNAKQKEAEIIEEAKSEAIKIRQRAEREIDLERKKAIDELKSDMIQIAEHMARKAVATSIDIKIQEELLENALKEIGDKTWQN